MAIFFVNLCQIYASMDFNFDFPLSSIILFCIAAACACYVCTVYCLCLYLPRRQRRFCEQQAAESGAFPSVSVIVYASNQPLALERNLPMILSQDYPAPFEVIVVNDGADVDTNAIVGRLKETHPNLYLTFTPDGARNLSRKKLGLTLGIKAAKGDVVVMTEATSRFQSDKWLASLLCQMAQNSGTDIVLGYGHPAFPSERSAGRLARIFDITADSVAWLSAAISGHPYRACGYNLAYKRSLFFANKGFSSSLNLRDGDDDILISEIARRGKAAVELSPDSLAIADTFDFKRETREWRASHYFTGRHLSKCSRRLMAAGEWSLWLCIACSLAAAILAGTSNAAGWSAAAALIVASMLAACLSWRSTLIALYAQAMAWSLPALVLLRPLRNMAASLRSKRAAHYTWIKKD